MIIGDAIRESATGIDGAGNVVFVCWQLHYVIVGWIRVDGACNCMFVGGQWQVPEIGSGISGALKYGLVVVGD